MEVLLLDFVLLSDFQIFLCPIGGGWWWVCCFFVCSFVWERVSPWSPDKPETTKFWKGETRRQKKRGDLSITPKPHSPAWDLVGMSVCLDSGLLLRRYCNSPHGKQKGRGVMERSDTVHFSAKSPPPQSCFCRQSSGTANSGMPPGLHDSGTSLLAMATLSVYTLREARDSHLGDVNISHWDRHSLCPSMSGPLATKE